MQQVDLPFVPLDDIVLLVDDSLRLEFLFVAAFLGSRVLGRLLCAHQIYYFHFLLLELALEHFLFNFELLDIVRGFIHLNLQALDHHVQLALTVLHLPIRLHLESALVRILHQLILELLNMSLKQFILRNLLLELPVPVRDDVLQLLHHVAVTLKLLSGRGHALQLAGEVSVLLHKRCIFTLQFWFHLQIDGLLYEGHDRAKETLAQAQSCRKASRRNAPTVCF